MIEDKDIRIKDNSGKLYYSSSRGVFATKGESVNVSEPVECREVFAYNFKEKTKFIIFGKNRINIKKINNFFEQIEDKLNTKEKTIFYPSSIENAIVIKPSPFWKENPLRRGIFTLFLRCAACHYNGKDIYKSLLNYGLIKKIIGPIEWFMKGNTKPLIKISAGRVVEELSVLSKKDWENSLVT